MRAIPILVAAVYGVTGFIVLIALIYLVVKRIDEKKREDFEKRSN
jgi:uncharacterized membrane protein YkvI